MPQITLASFNPDWGRETGHTDLLGRLLEKGFGKFPTGNYQVAAAVASLESDVIHLQEVWNPDEDNHSDNFLTRLREAGYHIAFQEFMRMEHMGDGKPSVDIDKANGSGGIAIVSRFPFTDIKPLDLGHTKGDPVGKRAALAVTIERDDVELTLICVHASRFLPKGPIPHLRKLRDQLPPPGQPVVVAGDCNWPRFATQRIMRATTIGAAGVVSKKIGPTWPAQRPVTQLDQIMARPADVQISRAEVVKPLGSQSDHLGVRVQVAWGRELARSR